MFHFDIHSQEPKSSTNLSKSTNGVTNLLARHKVERTMSDVDGGLVKVLGFADLGSPPKLNECPSNKSGTIFSKEIGHIFIPSIFRGFLLVFSRG